MKALELTKEHKDKLLEMCKSLFLEYDRIEFGNSECSEQFYDDAYIHFGYNNEKYQDSFNVIYSIHWLQIILIQIPERFYPKYDTFINGTGADFQEDMYNYCIVRKKEHPVDYLYEEFKQIK